MSTSLHSTCCTDSTKLLCVRCVGTHTSYVWARCRQGCRLGLSFHLEVSICRSQTPAVYMRALDMNCWVCDCPPKILTHTEVRAELIFHKPNSCEAKPHPINRVTPSSSYFESSILTCALTRTRSLSSRSGTR